MPELHDPDELPLFRDSPGHGPALTIRSWRATPADSWAEAFPSPRALESHYRDVLRRDLEFLEALERAGVPADTPPVGRFLQRHVDLVEHFVRRLDTDATAVGADVEATVQLVVPTVAELAGLRRQILEELDPERRRTALAAESRVRIPDAKVERAIAIAAFERAEEHAELGEIESPAPAQTYQTSGMIDNLVRHLLESWRADQERRSLPARGRLATLLSQIPVSWLDAIWEGLGLDRERPRNRKERERCLARHLTGPDSLRDVVENRLSVDERRALAYLLEKGGRAPAGGMTRRFGDDAGDGWFWHEEPPTSTLGRLRLHGLAFVGVDPHAVRRTRVVLVPPELREPLGEILDAHDGVEADVARTDSDPRPDVLEALEAAFPAGMVELVGAESWLTESLDDLRHALSQLHGAEVLYERPPEGESRHSIEDDPDDLDELDDAAWDEEERSYALFFVAPRGEEYSFEIEGDFMDEQGRSHVTTGIGQIGYAVAISTLAPFALLRMTSLDTEEDPAGEVHTLRPDIRPRYFSFAGEPQTEEAFLLEPLTDPAVAALHDLRYGIVRVLETFGIGWLPEEEARKPVPWLEADTHVRVGTVSEKPLTVEDAFFFRCL